MFGDDVKSPTRTNSNDVDDDDKIIILESRRMLGECVQSFSLSTDNWNIVRQMGSTERTSKWMVAALLPKHID